MGNLKEENGQPDSQSFASLSTNATTTEEESEFLNTTATPEIKNIPVDEAQTVKPYIRTTLIAAIGDNSLFQRSADLYVNNGLVTAGENSRTGERVDDFGMATVYTDDGTVEIEFLSFDKYDSYVEVIVLGLEDTTYTLSVTFSDLFGIVHDFTFSSSTKEKSMDTYKIKIENGELAVNRVRFGEKEEQWLEFIDDDGVCDFYSLQEQLVSLLTNDGWDMNAVPLVNTQTGYIDGSNFRPLAFETEKVCAIKMDFREYFPDVIPETKKWKEIMQYSNQRVFVSGEDFGDHLADGPLASSNIMPFTTTGNEIQYLYTSEGTSLIPVNFPVFSTCPCTHSYSAILTAPMYPPVE